MRVARRAEREGNDPERECAQAGVAAGTDPEHREAGGEKRRRAKDLRAHEGNDRHQPREGDKF